MQIKILIVDSEPLLIEQIKYSLDEYYVVEKAIDEEDAFKKMKIKNYDMIIINETLPKIDGYRLCKEIRKSSLISMIMLIDTKEDVKKIMALEFGADDCLAKPFNILELKARIKAILRRCRKLEDWNCVSSEFEIGKFKLNTLRRKIFFEDNGINLTGKEFDLFLLLTTNPNKIFSREDLLQKIWGYDYYGELRTVDVHIRRLREKIEKDSSNPKYILTKWGEGYYFKLNN